MEHPPPLDPKKYTFSQGYDEHDAPTMMQIVLENSIDNIEWQLMLRDTPTHQANNWLRSSLFPSPMSNDQFLKTFVVRDVSSKQIVAFASLQWPKPVTEQQKHQQQQQQSEDKPASPTTTAAGAGAGADGEATKNEWLENILATAPATVDQEFTKIFLGGKMMDPMQFGYDPTKHFRRQGTMVQRTCQKQGLGTLLTRYCNRIADEYEYEYKHDDDDDRNRDGDGKGEGKGKGRPTFVFARPAGVKLFENCGFREIGAATMDISRFGGPRDWTKMCLRREVRGS